MTPELFDEWLAYDLLEPIGDELLVGTLARIGAYQLRAEGYKDMQPDDLIPEWNPESKRQKQEQASLSPNQAASFVRALVGSR